ncbi:MAG: CotH kinase family protein [Flavobacteriales bacterium]|nr:CotH kinase family protein [Flavobacteriales bacterium]
MRAVLLILLFGLFTGNIYSQDLDSSTVVFSISGGIYKESIQLELSTLGEKIYYTTNGKIPSSSSKRYSDTIILDKTTPVRAVAYKNGRPGKTVTHTYLIGRDYTMAVISITGNPDDFFSFDRGIYVKGCCADSVPPYKRANFWKGWERRINIEFYEPSGELGFNQRVGVRIFGGFSKGLPMKSLAIISRKKYEKKTIEYPIFPNKDIKKYKSFVLRNSGSDFNNTQFRDALLTNLIESLDVGIQAYRPAVVFINGSYWGVHNVREKINEYYLKSNAGVDPDSVDIMKHRNDLLAGKRDHYLKMKRFINKTDFKDTAKIRHLNTLMDIDNFINYNITEVYVGNRDAGGNIRFWRPQTPGGRWRWILFDTDISFGISGKTSYKRNTLNKMTIKHNEAWPDPAWSTLIIRNLLENDSIKNLYINRFADHLNTLFSAETVNFKIDSIQNMLKDEMPYHFQKWRSSNIERWERNVQKMKDYASNRPYYVRLHLMDRFDLSDTITVDIQNQDPKAGYVQINSIRVDSLFQGVYFKDAAPSLEAKAKYGYEFLKWFEFDSVGTTKFFLTESAVLKPIFQKKELSQYSSVIVLNEISTHQDSIAVQGDWIELYNASNVMMDLSGWKVVSGNNEFIFPDSSNIKSKGYLLLSANYKEMALLTNGQVLNVPLGFGLSSKKDNILIMDSKGFMVDSLSYDIEINFPTLKGSQNRNIERVNPVLDRWKPSVKSSPGKENDLFEPIKSHKIEKQDDSGFYIGVGWALVALLLISGFFVRKKRVKAGSDSTA